MHILPEIKKDSFGRPIADNKLISLDDYLLNEGENENQMKSLRQSFKTVFGFYIKNIIILI